MIPRYAMETLRLSGNDLLVYGLIYSDEGGMSLSQMADILNIARSSVANILRRLTEQGLIEREGGLKIRLVQKLDQSKNWTTKEIKDCESDSYENEGSNKMLPAGLKTDKEEDKDRERKIENEKEQEEENRKKVIQRKNKEEREEREREERKERETEQETDITDKNIIPETEDNNLCYKKKEEKEERKETDDDILVLIPEEVSPEEEPLEVRRFRKPTVQEIKDYCQQRKNGIDPEQFFSYYQSKGWTVGKYPMKDWKAAVRTWEIQERKRQEKRQYQKPSKPSYADILRNNAETARQIFGNNTIPNDYGF